MSPIGSTLLPCSYRRSHVHSELVVEQYWDRCCANTKRNMELLVWMYPMYLRIIITISPVHNIDKAKSRILKNKPIRQKQQPERIYHQITRLQSHPFFSNKLNSINSVISSCSRSIRESTRPVLIVTSNIPHERLQTSWHMQVTRFMIGSLHLFRFQFRARQGFSSWNWNLDGIET